MQIAAELLTASSSLMVEIAERCGYTSEVAFRKTFRRHMGVAPGAYRKMNQTPRGTLAPCLLPDIARCP
jgi:transcriptional regulator GlxA family with amidase domain